MMKSKNWYFQPENVYRPNKQDQTCTVWYIIAEVEEVSEHGKAVSRNFCKYSQTVLMINENLVLIIDVVLIVEIWHYNQTKKLIFLGDRFCYVPCSF